MREAQAHGWRQNSSWLTTLPRTALGFLPTPLTPLDRLSAELGGPRIWLKRDDCTGLAIGGNKTRKLEYLLADAQASGADRIMTFGAVQSNHARQTAAACAALGLPCHLILTRRVAWQHTGYETAGNVLLDHLFGAAVEIVAPEAAAATVGVRLAGFRGAGERVYVIPTGGSNPVGALGYARCALELLEQSEMLGLALTDVIHASSSAGTQAGLVAGFAALCPAPAVRPQVHGMNVYTRDPEPLAEAVLTMASALLATHRPGTTVDVDAVRLDNRHLGADYGLPTPATVAGIRQLAATEGVLMDPVYSGKAFGGLLQCIRAGEYADRSDLVFIHTGGTPVLSVYERAFD
jgi:L-cysteate sulfo-lyase